VLHILGSLIHELSELVLPTCKVGFSHLVAFIVNGCLYKVFDVSVLCTGAEVRVKETFKLNM
jgi:hypothetical protein